MAAAASAGSLKSIQKMDATRMCHGLYQGALAKHRGRTIGIHDIHAAYVLAPDANVTLVAPQRVWTFPLHDHPSDLEHLHVLDAMALDAATIVAANGRVAIFCNQGRNRSGLVTALVLRYVKGMSGAQAVRHIKKHRDTATRKCLSGDACSDCGGTYPNHVKHGCRGSHAGGDYFRAFLMTLPRP